ncbi:hypothetical protein [Archangium lansingense]|uniref:DUF4123 domain-containing protein n=1 Tax=Archangium lansingense TaxID=2995310 RepID=A0ABT3ZVR5_9BACT|nr:hypothetical protein [Archangium lansinium]MCY1073159.1 hypothetical protein [Archangium lansinium]
MIVTIDDAVFATQVDPLLLLSLIRYGFEGRHIVVTSPPFKRGGKNRVNTWLAERDEFVRDAVIAAFDRSRRALSNSASLVDVRVADRKQSHWESSPPLLTPEDAALLLALPLWLVFENRLTDKHFLLCVASEPRRTALKNALLKGWLRAEHGGGLGDMGRYIAGLREDPAERLRTWVMFDSDAASPGQPSSQSEALKMKCVGASVPHHQLQRRSIENYLPARALWHWAGSFRGFASTDRQRLVRQFEAMSPEQRYHLDMKETFDEHIAELFQEEAFRIDPEWLRQDDQGPEVDNLLQGLFGRM